MERRDFLKIAGVSAIGAAGSVKVFAESGHASKPYVSKTQNALTAKHWAMVIDTRRFTSPEDLEPIIAACDKIHNLPDIKNKNHEIKWIWEEEFEHAFPDTSNKYLSEKLANTPFPVLCNHCENAPCVRACPTKATFQREDGIVMMDFHRCIGCRFCMAACPFGSRSFNFRDPRPFIKETNKEFPTRMKGVVEKCNFCAERLAVGQLPACVEASNGAIAFGDIEDPDSEVRELLKNNYTIRRRQSLGTEPSVYYIV